MEPTPTPRDKLKIWAHAGAGLIAEKEYGLKPNSLQAFQWSVAVGVDGFETDVCLTQDREPIICHPSKLDPDPQNLTWKETRRIYPHILHLEELADFLLTSALHTDCLLHIQQDSKELVRIVVAGINKGDLFNRVILTASRNKIQFAQLYTNASLLSYARSIDPRIKIHIIDTFPFNVAATAQKFNADIVSFGWLNNCWQSIALFEIIFYKKMLRQCVRLSDRNFQLIGGIVKNSRDIVHLMRCTGELIDGVMTDSPDTTVEFLRS